MYPYGAVESQPSLPPVGTGAVCSWVGAQYRRGVGGRSEAEARQCRDRHRKRNSPKAVKIGQGSLLFG